MPDLRRLLVLTTSLAIGVIVLGGRAWADVPPVGSAAPARATDEAPRGGPPTLPIALVATAGVLLSLGWGVYWTRRGRHRVSAED